MAARNDVTGDLIKSKPLSRTYEENYDNIFRKETPVDGSTDEPSSDYQRNTPLVGFRETKGRLNDDPLGK